ncbi:unnamed protein product [Pleuronectes platessa]|uniref:Uncharacterized protein n=1 Tax=Pleuronectes platessa TaxID=8262 RepID=A0A9N7V582_PLEPL|nr:unnamed protein product [Pleuronectes platessa]
MSQFLAVAFKTQQRAKSRQRSSFLLSVVEADTITHSARHLKPDGDIFTTSVHIVRRNGVSLRTNARASTPAVSDFKRLREKGCFYRGRPAASASTDDPHDGSV